MKAVYISRNLFTATILLNSYALSFPTYASLCPSTRRRSTLAPAAAAAAVARPRAYLPPCRGSHAMNPPPCRCSPTTTSGSWAYRADAASRHCRRRRRPPRRESGRPTALVRPPARRPPSSCISRTTTGRIAGALLLPVPRATDPTTCATRGTTWPAAPFRPTGGRRRPRRDIRRPLLILYATLHRDRPRCRRRLLHRWAVVALG